MRIESKAISQNLLLQKELKAELKKRDLSILSVEDRLRMTTQELKLCR